MGPAQYRPGTELDRCGGAVSGQAHGLVLRSGMDFPSRSVGALPLWAPCIPSWPADGSACSRTHDHALDGNRARSLVDHVAAPSHVAGRYTGPDRSWRRDLVAIVLA